MIIVGVSVASNKNPDNNLESLCIFNAVCLKCLRIPARVNLHNVFLLTTIGSKQLNDLILFQTASLT
jgi:hypothetical protein